MLEIYRYGYEIVGIHVGGIINEFLMACGISSSSMVCRPNAVSVFFSIIAISGVILYE